MSKKSKSQQMIYTSKDNRLILSNLYINKIDKFTFRYTDGLNWNRLNIINNFESFFHLYKSKLSQQLYEATANVNNYNIQPYFDIEYYDNYDKHLYRKNFCKYFTQFCSIYKLGKPSFYCIDGSGLANRKKKLLITHNQQCTSLYRLKVSWHIIIRGIGYLKNPSQFINIVNLFMYWLEITIKTDFINRKGSNYQPNSGIDTSVYKSNHQLYRMPYSLKDKRPFNIYYNNSIILLKDCPINLFKLHLVQCVTDDNIMLFKNIPIISLKKTTSTLILNKIHNSGVPKSIYSAIKYHNVKFINPGKYNNSIEWLLQCIPSQDNLWGWRYIGMTLKNCNCDVNMWIKWSRGCNNFDEDECIEQWETLPIRNPKKGYNKGTLKRIACICLNKKYGKQKAKIKFPDVYPIMWKINTFITKQNKIINKSKYSIYRDKIIPNIKVIEYNNRYVSDNTVPQLKQLKSSIPFIFIHSLPDTGKSYSIHTLLTRQLNKNQKTRILCLTTRIMYAFDLFASLRKKNLYAKVYKNINNKSNMDKEQFLICQMESLHWIKQTYDIIIIDECESIFKNITAQTIKYPLKTMKIMEKIIKNAKQCIFADAFISNRTKSVLQKMYSKMQFPKSIYYKNTYKHDKKIVIRYSYHPKSKKSKMIQVLFDKLIFEQKKCVFVCAHKKLANIVYKQALHYEIDVQKYDSDTDDYDKSMCMFDVNKNWKCNLLIYTPSITCGVNMTEKWFDELFIFSSVLSCTVRDTFQSAFRVRNFKSNIIHCMHNLINFSGYYSPCDENHINELLTLCKNNNHYQSIPKWFEHLIKLNLAEDNRNRHSVKHLEDFNYYAECVNWELRDIERVNNKNIDDYTYDTMSHKQIFYGKWYIHPYKIQDAQKDINQYNATLHDKRGVEYHNIAKKLKLTLDYDNKHREYYSLGDKNKDMIFHNMLFNQHWNNSASQFINQIDRFIMDINGGGYNKAKNIWIKHPYFNRDLNKYKIINDLYQCLEYKNITKLKIGPNERKKIINLWKDNWEDVYKILNKRITKKKNSELIWSWNRAIVIIKTIVKDFFGCNLEIKRIDRKINDTRYRGSIYRIELPVWCNKLI